MVGWAAAVLTGNALRRASCILGPVFSDRLLMGTLGGEYRSPVVLVGLITAVFVPENGSAPDKNLRKSQWPTIIHPNNPGPKSSWFMKIV